MTRAPTIAVIGAGDAPAEVRRLAGQVGRAIAEAGATVVCGGLGGVMEAAARGAREAGGRTVGILPGTDSTAANPWIEIAIATGLGEARNSVVVTASDGVVALAGEGGTLAEIGFALKLRRPVVALRSWPGLEGIGHEDDPARAVARVLRPAG